MGNYGQAQDGRKSEFAFFRLLQTTEKIAGDWPAIESIVPLYCMPVTQSVPGGFLLVFFGLLSLVLSGLAGYAGWLVYHREVIEHIPTGYSMASLFAFAGALLLVAVALVVLGLKMAWEVESYDTRDPDQPSVKF